MKRCIAVLTMIVVTALGCSGDGGGKQTAQSSGFPDSLVDNELIRTVNGRQIRAKDLRLYAAMYRPQRPDTMSIANFNRALLSDYCDRVMLWQVAEMGGIQVPDSMVSSVVFELIREMGGGENVDRVLGELELERYDLAASVKRDLAIRALVEQEAAATPMIPDAELRTYFDQNPHQFIVPDSLRARHIVVSVTADDTPETRADKLEKIEEALRRVKSGEDFASVAREMSEGPSARNGGNLGTFAKRDMVPSFADPAAALKRGEISDIITTPFGYHVIKSEGMIPGRQLTFEEVKPQLSLQMQSYVAGQSMENRLQQLRSTAIIEDHF